MPIRRYKQSNGTVVEAEFTENGRQVKINNGEASIWAPANLEMLDLPQDSQEDREAKRASHRAAKAQLERDMAYEKADTRGIVFDKRNGTISRVETMQLDPKPATEEPIWLVENPNKRRR